MNTEIKLTKRQKEFCKLYAKYGGNSELICKKMNIKPSSYWNLYSNPVVKEYIACSMERTKASILAALPHIQSELLHMFNCSNVDGKIKIEIAKQFMDRAGLIQDKNVNLSVNINTQIAERAKQIMVEKQQAETIETTAEPVVERISAGLGENSTIDIAINQPVAEPVTAGEDLHNNGYRTLTDLSTLQ